MRIGNAQDANGRNYLTGISVVENGSAIASDIVSISNGSGISFSSSMDGGLVVNAVFTPLVESISSKVEKPSSGDVSGLVLATNGDGTTSWVENGGESVPWSKLSSKPATIDAMPSSVGSNGQLLVADSNGSMIWKTPDSAITSDSRNPPSASAVNAAIRVHVNANGMHLPFADATSRGKVLKVDNVGNPTWATDLTLEGSAVLPAYDSHDALKVLRVTSDGNGTEWSENQGSGVTVEHSLVSGSNPIAGAAIYNAIQGRMPAIDPAGHAGNVVAVNNAGNGYELSSVVRSATNATSASYATSAVYINGHTVSKDVPSDAVFTDTVPGSGVLTINAYDSTIGTFDANASVNSTITIPKATSASYGLAKVETAIANTTNAVANAVVSAISSSMGVHIDSSALHVPYATQMNNGQVLKVEDGVPVWSTDLTGGGSAVLPSYGVEDANKVLKVNEAGDGTLWASETGGSSVVVDSFISSDGANPVAGATIHSALVSKMDIVLGGETGQVLTRTADGVEWGTVYATGGVPVQVSGVDISSIVAGSNIIMNVVNGVLYLSAVATANSLDIVDGGLDSASTNPVENRVLWSSFENMSSQLGNVSSLLEEL